MNFLKGIDELHKATLNGALRSTSKQNIMKTLEELPSEAPLN